MMKFFSKRDLGILGCRKRMYRIWCDEDMFQVTEQRLMGQMGQILNDWLTDLELDHIKKNLQQVESQAEVENQEVAQDIEDET